MRRDGTATSAGRVLSLTSQDRLLNALPALYPDVAIIHVHEADRFGNCRIRGTTVAELGNMNKPLDLIVYSRGGQDYLLLANSARGVMKIALKDLGSAEGLTAPVRGGAQAGLKAETIPNLKGVVQLAQLDKDNALVLVKAEGGGYNLETVPLP